ncbi:hypothetical protein [Chryseobacterium sp. MP_3.2]|uniref:hypothetical protein n=1 Tax=Chryseobacterium sp. MP_3.2 TaxID=3071712 RepID=UPI002E01CB4E|nr:hypothetical protein [Chryseobacterium sp. MP_3.2]
MKFLSAIFFLLMANMMFSQNLPELRTLLKTGETSEASAKVLIDKSSTAFTKTKQPIYAGFMAIGQFFMAKHAFSPFKKMSYFNEGKKNLDNAIIKDPKNAEIRLLRLITQEKAPKLLGYSKNISEDKRIITSEYTKIEDEALKLYIKNYLNL